MIEGSPSWFALRVVRENPLQASQLDYGGLLAIIGIPWLVDTALRPLLFVHIVFSLPASLYMAFFL